MNMCAMNLIDALCKCYVYLSYQVKMNEINRNNYIIFAAFYSIV